MAKIVIIGAGHNGLVTACYLAKAGHGVEIFESRDVVGGCATTDETTFPGFKISSASYVNSLFLPQIVEDLDLEKYGYEVLPRNPSSFTPLPNGKYLFLGPDMEENVREISKFSEKDARAYPKYEKALEEIAELADSMMTMTPPNFPPYSLSDMGKYLKLAGALVKLGPVGCVRLFKLLTQDARKFLDSWFESDVLKATLLTDSAIGAMGFSGYVLLHHVMGEAGGARGVWGYQRGGMGAISNALAAAAKDLGVKIHTNCPVRNVTVDFPTGKAVGVCLNRNELVHADVVVSNADPKRTFEKLIPREAFNGSLSVDNGSGFLEKIKSLDFRSPVMKINLTLSGLPNFRCMPGTEIGPQHKGTIHISPSVACIEEAHEQGNAGVPSSRPILEVTIPSAIDDTVAPRGKHVMNIFVQYAPYHLADGSSWDDIEMGYFRAVRRELHRYISNIYDIIEGVEILSPLDLERRFSISEGNIFHGALGLDQLFSFRPVRGYADYRTPVKGLYLCGAGTHPGGGVTGACGLNASREILADLELEPKLFDGHVPDFGS